MESRIREIFASGIRNLGLWNPEYSLRNPENPLKLAIQNRSSTNKDWNKVSGIRNSWREIQNSRLFWLTLHGATYWCYQQFICSLVGQGYYIKNVNSKYK